MYSRIRYSAEELVQVGVDGDSAPQTRHFEEEIDMTRSEQGGESRGTLAVEPKSERRTGRIRRSCPARTFSTRLLLVAIAALAVVPSPAGAQRGMRVLEPNIPRVQLQRAPCGPETMTEVRGTGSEPVPVACSLTLGPNETITKKIGFYGSAASGAILQCTCDAGGCTTLSGGISIGSYGTDRPENITVRNCTITDSDVSLESPDPCQERKSPSPCADKRSDFVQWVRARAPRRITFDNVTIAGTGHNRFYVGWGATETKLINSVIEGEASGVPIYLAPHSSGTLIKNNRIETVTTAPGTFRTTEREMISIDGSDHNRIISNWFGRLDKGGIYVFRNCGEEGGIRHTTPSHNHIINNAFPYNKYDGPNPAVFLGSRDGNPPGWEIGSLGSYCDDDEGYPYGSSADDRDFATHNVVMQNWIIKRPEAAVIKSTNWVNNAMNLIDRNKTVKTATWPLPPAGCYVRGGAKEFILHGETTEKFMRDDGSPTSDKVTCNDGELRPALLTADFAAPPKGVTMRSSTPAPAAAPPSVTKRSSTPAPAAICNTRRVPIDCRISEDNEGCDRTFSCPAGMKVVGAVAACNLEYGAVSDAELATVPPHLIHVARLSDDIEDGSCYVENNAVIGKIFGGPYTGPLFVPQSAVQAPIRGIVGLSRVAVGCDEHDKNGGDCHIRGSLYCR